MTHLAILLLVGLLWAAPAQAQVAFDAWSNAAAASTADSSWTHTPSGTPKAVVCAVVVNTTSDTVNGVTYGGGAMTEVSGSPLFKATGDAGATHVFFLGSSIPTGAQTVAVDTNGGSVHHEGCATLTATTDTELVDVDATVNIDSQADPSVTLSAASRTVFALIGFFSGQNDVTAITPFANWTARLEHDFGANSAGFYTFDTIGTSDVTAGWTQTADDAVMIALAVAEVSVGGATPSRGLLLGVGP